MLYVSLPIPVVLYDPIHARVCKPSNLGRLSGEGYIWNNLRRCDSRLINFSFRPLPVLPTFADIDWRVPIPGGPARPSPCSHSLQTKNFLGFSRSICWFVTWVLYSQDAQSQPWNLVCCGMVPIGCSTDCWFVAQTRSCRQVLLQFVERGSVGHRKKRQCC